MDKEQNAVTGTGGDSCQDYSEGVKQSTIRYVIRTDKRSDGTRGFVEIVREVPTGLIKFLIPPEILAFVKDKNLSYDDAYVIFKPVALNALAYRFSEAVKLLQSRNWSIDEIEKLLSHHAVFYSIYGENIRNEIIGVI